jgi:anti-sigma regulatory factor (Ser/Thr protein kinase)
MAGSGPPSRPDSAASGAAELGHVVLDADNEVAQARALIHEFHVSLGAVGALIDDVVLVTSELVTNAVLHGSPPVGLLARASSRWLHVEVHDHSSAMPLPQDADDYDEHGRGLGIVAALAIRWGTRPTTAGKVVWAEIDGDAGTGDR